MTTAAFDRTWIDRYEAGAELLAPAIAGLSSAELDAHPVPGTWSVRQIVVHLLESDLAAMHRMRRISVHMFWISPQDVSRFAALRKPR